jgi:hypothetical protein
MSVGNYLLALIAFCYPLSVDALLLTPDHSMAKSSSVYDMNTSLTGHQITRRLYKLRNKFDRESSLQKLQLLQALRSVSLSTSSDIRRLHSALCFIRAFPDSTAHYRHARAELIAFDGRVSKLANAEQEALADSGIAGSLVYYRFSYAVAVWLARRTSGSVVIDWEELQDTAALDELLSHLLETSEDEYFDSGLVSTEEWLRLAGVGKSGTDFDWLLGNLKGAQLTPYWSQLYDAADIPLGWKLGNSAWSKSCNALPIRKVHTREQGMRTRDSRVKKTIARPVESISRVSASYGTRLIDMARAALATRHRETYHFNHANPKEVYLTDIGAGVSIAIFGLLPAKRFALECTMGYLIISNGVPIGYGGSSVLFRQVNSGINIFDEFRGSEAAYLWAQVMRVQHHLFGCTRFIANAYQFGGDNDEALNSGAFWFYYRLGYRPVLPKIRKLAQQESARIRRDSNHRSSMQTLRKLGGCDMHLTLPGAKQSDLFDEQWLETISMLATRELGAVGGNTRQVDIENVAETLARNVDLRSIGKWSDDEVRAYRRLAPIVTAAKPENWPADARRSIRELLRSKGGQSEASYARLMGEHDEFCRALQASCRGA